MSKQNIGELEHTKKYIPKRNELYYFVNASGSVDYYHYNSDIFDEWIIKHNHVFRSEEDCEIYRAYLELLDDYSFEPDWEDVESRKYHIIYNHDTKEIDCDVEFAMQYYKHFFETSEKLNEFIEKAGEQNIKRFMFDIWE